MLPKREVPVAYTHLHHGVYKEENVLGQKFLVNIVSKVDTRAAGKTDELELSVSYGDICRCVKKEMTKQNDKLLERVAERLAECILCLLYTSS